MKKDLTSRKWFFAVLTVALFIPPLTETAYQSADTNIVISEVLYNAFVYQYSVVYSLIKITFIGLCLGLQFKKAKVKEIFDYFIGLLMLLTTIGQNYAITPTYGRAAIPGNAILMLVVTAAWILQMFSNQANRIKGNVGKHKYWLVGLALLAFWFPLDTTGSGLKFTLGELFFNESMVTFCMLIPVILVVTILVYDRINLKSLKIISFIGLLFGILNMITWFILTRQLWLMGVMHLPLLLISVYVFIIVNRELGKTTANI